MPMRAHAAALDFADQPLMFHCSTSCQPRPDGPGEPAGEAHIVDTGLGGSMRVAVRAAVLAAAVAGVAIEAWAIRAGWSWAAAALDLLAGWSLLAAAGWSTYLTGGCRALLGLSGVFWFLATPQVVGGAAGHAAALLGAAWLAPLATAMLGSPRAVPARPLQRGVAAACWLRAFPALAGIGWLTAVTGGCLAVAALADSRRNAVTVQRWAAALAGTLLGISGLLEAVAGRGSALEPLVAVSVAGCGIAVLATRPAQAATGSGLAGLVVELGRATDARSLERRLARAVGDPGLRLLYQLAPGLPYVSASGVPAARPAAGRTVTVMGQSGPVVAALEHDSEALQDPRLRQAVLAVGRLAVRRLMRAAEAAEQAVELAESRRRLVEAEDAARDQFARAVSNGPGRALGVCLAALDELVKTAPDGLRADVAEARAAGQAARDELVRAASGDVGLMLARRGLAAALLDLAAAAGARADVRIDRAVDAGPATAAWFAASEALTNALKHAGPARIWLTAVTGAGGLRVEVADDGVGGADQDGHGLTGLRERLAGNGGELRVLADAAGGTRVVAEIPLNGSSADGGVPPA
jgi:signal transduction histidine kinase